MIINDNYSDWIRKACWEKLDREGDTTLINQEIKELENRIVRLKEKKKPKVNENKIQELLAYHAPNYKLNAPMRTEGQRIRFIKQALLPQLKKAGSTSTPEEIDQILIDWPED